ncbi:spermidine/putrescine ABC transporter substrate-binding protein [Burkholderia pseudomallei]|uniref:ABC transporter substrate-binding protein n=1 Tax=Burkholderia pseudomallei TaxID=28450 RepID=UPI000973AA4B|nr:extracellular solute-binding protein [Burkholderia pseudomallei]APY98733.1 spermidine/putrescine ABC transporter substrate-binding protein [Burkholderia pseudomallei]APZ12317.1 spermidine/putrescine ABC transporter substrate-binding protein [Burkholderia pseudomallei]
MKAWLTLLLTMTFGFVQAAELHLANWPDWMPPELLKKFEKETGIKTTLDIYDSDATLLSKLQAGGGGYDVVVAGDYYVQVFAKNGLVRKLDKSRLRNMANIMPKYRHPLFDPNRDYTVPYLIFMTGFAYDGARVPGGKLDDSWKSLFDPPAALRGEIADLDSVEELYMAASWYLKQDECTENPEDAKRVLAVLRKQKPYVKTYSNEGTIDRMISRQVVVQHGWSGATVRVQRKLPSAAFALPREGVRMAQDNFLIPAKAKNVNEAHTFLNWMMKPENMAAASNAYLYPNEISGAERYMSADLLKNPAVMLPAAYKERLRPFKLCSPAALALRDKVWTLFKQ